MRTSLPDVHSTPGRRDRAHRFFYAAGVIITAGAACGARLGHAQEAGPNETKLQEVIVSAPRYVPDANRSATKLDVPLIETPQAISVIHRDQLDLLGWQNVDQTVRYTSGVVGENFGADERFDWFLIRGYPPVQYVDGLQEADVSRSLSGRRDR